MRRIVILSIILLLVVDTFAQIQQGYVKTIGRPNRPGISLDGVVVRISGNINDILSNSEGKFSFPIREKIFKFSRISKKGYELADHDFLNRKYGYTPGAPVTIVLVSKAELQKERDIIEDSIRNKISTRFQRENAVLERKLERMQLSEGEFEKQLLALKEKYDNIDTLVSTLSERYARTDYDNIDSLRLLINNYIENGDLERAQQLIFSKGSLAEREKELEETRKLRLQTQQHEEELQKDLAEDLYQLCKIAWNRQQYDSAYIYMEKRYFTDTTQVKYLYDIASMYFPRVFFPDDERIQRERNHESYIFKLYDRNTIRNLASFFSEDSLYTKACIEGIIGNYYNSIEKEEKAILFYNKMYQTVIDGKLDFGYTPLLSIGNIYQYRKEYNLALEEYQKALAYCKKMRGKRPDVMLRIAETYYLMGDTKKALQEYLYVEKAYGTPNDSNVQTIKDLYMLQGFIAKNLSEKGEGKEAIYFYEKAAKNAERFFSLTNESKNIKHITILYRDLQEIYASQREYKQMYACAEKSIHYVGLYMERFPSSYSRLIYAEILCRMTDANANMGKTSTVEKELIECLKKSEFASNIFKGRYRYLTYNIYNTFATSYYKQGKYKEALNAINKSISLLPKETEAYQRKLEILNAIDGKEEMMKVDEILQKLQESHGEEKSDITISFKQYKDEYLNNY